MTVTLLRLAMGEFNNGAICYGQYVHVDRGGGAVVDDGEWWFDTPVTFLCS